MKKRLLPAVLALVMLIGTLTLNVSAAAEIDSGTCGPNLSWSLSSSGVLTISGSGAMTDYDYCAAPWAGHREKITTVHLPDGLTSIGSSAFWECRNLTAVSIPDSVTRIGGWAFFECSALTSVEIPDKVTALGNSTFAFCSSLSSLHINSDFSGNHNTFHECSSLTTLHIGPKVTKFYENFLHNLYALTTFTVDAGSSTFSAKNGLLLSKDGKALVYCPLNKAGTVVIPDGVTTIKQDSFLNHDYITAITFPDSLTTIEEGAFVRLPKLTSLTIPDSVTTIGTLAFYDCKKLTSVTIGNGVTSIGSRAFEKCTKLASVTLPDSLKTIGSDAFRGCKKLTSVEISNSLQELQSFAFYESGLLDLYFDGTEKEWKQLLSTGSNQLPDGVTVHWNKVEPVKKPSLVPNSSGTSAGANSGGSTIDRPMRKTEFTAVFFANTQ